MSRLDQLIEKLCPNGVEWKELGEVCENISTGKLNANASVINGKYPFFTCDEKPLSIDSYAFDTSAILISGNGSKVGHVNIYNGKFNAYQRTYVLYDFLDNLDIKFMYHYFKFKLRDYINLYSKKGSVPYITLPVLKKFKLPIPPLEIQEEIVHILDSFAELTNELTNELTARRKQYEHYRDSLLTFGDEVEWKELGEFATVIRGGNFQKKDFKTEGVPCIHYGQIYTKYGLKTDKTITFLDEKIASKSKMAKKNDIIMAVTSENIEDVCKCLSWLGDEDVAISGHTAIIKHNQNSLYLSYYFHTEMFYKQKLKLAHGTKVVEVTPSSLLNIKIPLPPLSEQERIVSILDKFDSLCNDITKGLPAEIEARKKQYEYYRDKLLTFKNISENK